VIGPLPLRVMRATEIGPFPGPARGCWPESVGGVALAAPASRAGERPLPWRFALAFGVGPREVGVLGGKVSS